MNKTAKRGVLLFVLILVLAAAMPHHALAEGLLLTPSSGGGLFGEGGGATGGSIDVSTASLGYITLQYSDGTSASMKAGVSFNGGSWSYYSYSMGKTKKLELTGGSGSYTVALFKKVSGNYVTVASASFTALISGTTPAGAPNIFGGGTSSAYAQSSQYAQYLDSTGEISFYANDSVSKKAAALCKGLKDDQSRIRAIYNFIARNFKYDYDFAYRVISGQIRTYTPNPVTILSNKKGVCYDFSSLFAAMCRSQGIPCKLVKGYSTKISGYHAWNSVYDAKTDAWYTVDLTLAVCRGNKTASRFSGCYMSNKYYTPRGSV